MSGFYITCCVNVQADGCDFSGIHESVHFTFKSLFALNDSSPVILLFQGYYVKHVCNIVFPTDLSHKLFDYTLSWLGQHLGQYINSTQKIFNYKNKFSIAYAKQVISFGLK